MWGNAPDRDESIEVYDNEKPQWDNNQKNTVTFKKKIIHTPVKKITKPSGSTIDKAIQFDKARLIHEINTRDAKPINLINP